jgi:hypothetical protein
VACALLAFVPAIMVSALLSGVVSSSKITRTLESRPFWYEQEKHALVSMSVTVVESGLRWGIGRFQRPAPLDRITFTLSSKHYPAVSLSMDRDGMMADNSVITNRTVQAWLTNAGMDPTTRPLDNLADDVLSNVDLIRLGRLEGLGFTDLEGGGNTFRASGGPAPQLYNWVWIIACVACGALAWRAWSLRRHPVHGEPTCAVCDEPARNFTELACPHCGVDPRISGFPVHERHAYAGMASRLAFWSIVLLLFGFVVGFVIDQTLWHTQASHSLVFTAPEHPTNEPVERLEVSTIADGWGTKGHDPKPNQVFVVLQVRGHRPATINLPDATTFVEVRAGGSTAQHALNTSELMAWIRDAGISTDSARVATLAKEIIAAVGRAWSWTGNITAGDIHFSGLEQNGGINNGFGTDAADLAAIQWIVWLIAWFAVT